MIRSVARCGAWVATPICFWEPGNAKIVKVCTDYDNYGFQTKILVASVRHPMHMVQAAMIGADVATVPFKVIQQVMRHPLTDAGLKRFLEDWKGSHPTTTRSPELAGKP